MDARTWRWWSFLRGVSLLNLGLLGLTAATQVWSVQLACAGIYVGVCAFRSFWPRIDLERTVLVDHPLSAIPLGRTAATIAEVAFTVQLALFLTDAGAGEWLWSCLLYTSPSPRDKRQSRMPSSA